MYNDEIAPGDQLQHHNARKTQAFYYSFLEFGADALSSEFLWFTLSATRSDDVSEINGLSFGTFAKAQMMSFEPWSSTGFQCGSIIIWAKVKLFVADESAIKFTLDVKGASGNLPCFKCRNCLSKKTFAKTRPNSDLLSITDIDYEAFLKHDDNSLKANAQFLAEQKSVLKKIQFEKLQTSLGLNYNPDGIILSGLDFMPISGTCYDPQHVLLVNGVFQSEVGQLVVVLKKMKITISSIASFFQSFSWPLHSKSGKNLFDHRSNSSITDNDKKHLVLSCDASDALGAFGLLQEFVMLRVFPKAQAAGKRVVAACASFFALCTVITMTTMIPRGGISPSKLMDAITKHLKLHKEAYGETHWVPKFHYSLHLPEQLERWDLLIFCFAHERKHKEIKRYLQGRQNTSATWDKNVLQDVLHIQKLALNEDFPYPRGTQLLHPRPAADKTVKFFCLQDNFPDSREILTSVDAKAGNFVTCHTDDVVYLQWDRDMCIGQIKLLCSVDGECMALVTIWTRLPQMNMYNVSGDDYFVLLSDIVDTCVYRIRDDVAYVVPPRGAVHRALVN